MIRAVLFDLDGTLADTALDLGFALNRQRQLHGLPPLSQDVIRPQASHGARGLLALGFGLTPADPQFPAMREEYLALYEKHICDHTVLFPGMDEVLHRLEQDGLKWGVVTNKPARFTVPLMAKLHLDNRTACIVSGDTTANSKPHPEPLLTAAAQIGVAPGECLYVGDAERDVEAALAAGMRVLIAMYGYLGENDRPETWGAHGFLPAPARLIEALHSA